MDGIIEIQNKIYEIRGVRVMLDFDLAALYQVETRVLNQAVKRNIDRFPDDFIFQLDNEEWEVMLSQIVMTSLSKRPKAALPYAFTEHGVVMLASILRSDRAIQASVRITRAFVSMRNYIRYICLHFRNHPFTVMLNEVKHLYNKDSSLTLRMTVSVIIYIVTLYNVNKAYRSRTVRTSGEVGTAGT